MKSTYSLNHFNFTQMPPSEEDLVLIWLVSTLAVCVSVCGCITVTVTIFMVDLEEVHIQLGSFELHTQVSQ